jgi:hypothetical protein
MTAIVAPINALGVDVFDVELVGVNAETWRKLVLSFTLVIVVLIARRLARMLADLVLASARLERARFGRARRSRWSHPR